MARRLGTVMACCMAMTHSASALAETATSPAYAPSPYAPPPSYAPSPVVDPHELPPPDPPRRPSKRRYSLPMMITGIGLTGVGGALEIAALFAVSVTFLNSVTSDRTNLDVAAGLAAGGLVCLAVGIPLLVVGAQKAPGRSAFLGAPTANGWGWRF